MIPCPPTPFLLSCRLIIVLPPFLVVVLQAGKRWFYGINLTSRRGFGGGVREKLQRAILGRGGGWGNLYTARNRRAIGYHTKDKRWEGQNTDAGSRMFEAKAKAEDGEKISRQSCVLEQGGSFKGKSGVLEEGESFKGWSVLTLTRVKQKRSGD